MRAVVLAWLLAVFCWSPLPAAEARVVQLPGAEVRVEFDEAVPREQQPLLLEWVAQSGRAVAAYYSGRFPVPEATLLIFSRAGRSVSGGYATGWNGPRARITVGREASRADLLEDDWMLTHEFIHFGFPGVPDQHHWLEEGIACYVEPVARVRLGVLDARRMWAEFVSEMPQGQPQPGDHGLDRTPTWARTYWGGAIFCLLADVEIRRQTDNRRGLEDALRAIVAAGGSIERSWPLARALAVGDAATGTTVLRDLHARLGPNPEAVDLEALWRSLGVVKRGRRQVEFDDSAPLAAVRRAITAGRP
ncbi:MAG: hypothetical protein JSR82_05295 [Verrucomicrobia bacterium]|nr:hypothetical protein [Verrucomicrobiota bacterium]